MKDKLKDFFKIPEFNTSNSEIPNEIAAKILDYFITPLNYVRVLFGKELFIRSGWRPTWYNKKIGGATNSQHLFKGKGACDVSPTKSGVKPTKADMDKLENCLIDSGHFIRIARYNTFFHCDYKGNERTLYNSKWVKIKLI